MVIAVAYRVVQWSVAEVVLGVDVGVAVGGQGLYYSVITALGCYINESITFAITTFHAVDYLKKGLHLIELIVFDRFEKPLSISELYVILLEGASARVSCAFF